MKSKPSEKLAGKWRITRMPDFDRKDVDADGPAYFNISKNGDSEFHFLYVHGNACGNYKTVDLMPTFDFTWDGNDECDDAQGDGWFTLKPDGSAHGEIRFHQGDTYAFQAKKHKKTMSARIPNFGQ